MSPDTLSDSSAGGEDSDSIIASLKGKNIELAKRLEREITTRKNLERRLSLNPKSGLPSHYRLLLDFDSIVEALDEKCPDRRLTVIVIRFGAVFTELRKSLKSSVIEWVLYQIGYRISLQRRSTDLLYHTRDNEFIIIAPGLRERELDEYIDCLATRLKEPHVFSGFNVALPSFMGIAYFPEHGNDKSAVLQAADIAIETAVENNFPVITFEKKLIEAATEKLELRNSIIRAIEAPSMERIDRQFCLFFQPKLFLSEVSNGHLQVERIEAEVLLRWQHPTMGLLKPERFLLLAEETGLILPIGKWLLYATIDFIENWKGKGLKPLSVSVNLSAKQFHSDDIVEILSKLVMNGSLDPSTITFELNETSVFDELIKAVELMNSFKRLGFKISLDDFGKGYSSLSVIQRLPIDELKIDKSFTENILKNESDKIIVQAVIDMALKMGLSVIAEGIEDIETLKEVFKTGCTGYQGYLFGSPMPFSGFEKFYRSVEDSGGRFPLPSLKKP